MNRAFHPIVFLLCLAFSLLAQQGVQAPRSYPGAFRPIFEEFPSESPLNATRPDLIDTITPAFAKDTLMIDFESRQVSYSRFDTLSGYPLWEFHYSEMNDYLKSMEKHTVHSLWKTKLIQQSKEKKKDGPALKLALPAHLPAWATRILGKEPPSLTITGSQKIKVGVKRTSNSVDGQELEDAGSTQPIFEPTSNFVIRGTVGRLLRLEIKLSGKTGGELFESVDDQLSNIKIEYRADSIGELEDDIIQEVVIGKTSFNMPGQGLAGYSSGSNDGLFGVKVRSQVGPLSLTSIVSIEQVETEKKTIDLTATNKTQLTGEKEMQKNTYYFLDEVYRLKYLAKFTNDPAYQAYLDDKEWKKAPKISTIKIYKKIPGTSIPNNPGKEYKWANYTYASGGEVTTTTNIFQLLVEDVDYRIDLEDGRINFLSRLSDNDVIGLYMDDEEGLNKKGNDSLVVSDITGLTVIKDLWVLKNDNNLTTKEDPLYNLMLRNVYSLSSSGTTPNFTIKRYVGEESSEKTEKGKYYAQILGLMDENENYLYGNEDIFDLTSGYVIIPPYKPSTEDTLYNDVTALYPFSNSDLGTTKGENNFGHIIYDDRSNTSWTNRFGMVTVNKERQTSFTLDFGVMEKSETLRANGAVLERDVDYRIDYGMGYVELLSERAKSASSIEAEYQKESLFFLDKKVFVGVNGKVNLPTIGRNSYLGTTFMWQLMDAKSLTPKVGTEPFDRFLFDANLEFDFEPEWMTALVNLIPLVSSDVASSARFSFEIAKSKVSNSTKANGEAYIDNFSTSARTYSLGVSQRRWHRASPNDEWLSEFNYHPPAWAFYWFQPVKGDNEVLKSEIYPLEKDANGNIDKNQKVSTLRLVVQPYPEDESLRQGVSNTDGTSRINPWAGIVQGFNGSLIDRQNDRYFEFWVRHSSWKKNGVGRKGELIVDLGRISEDISLDGQKPNSSGDYELINAQLSGETDIGIDALKDEEEKYWYPNFLNPEDPWVELPYGDERLGPIYRDDPARDNWKEYTDKNKENFRWVNGTSGNRLIKSTADLEDVDNDGAIYLPGGAYFRYRIDLSDIGNSKYLSPVEKAFTVDSGWHKIRIPIGDNASDDMIDDKKGSPSWADIAHVRLLWHNFDSTLVSQPGFVDTLEFEGLEFVGNLWREMVTDSFNVGRVTATIEDSRATSNYRRPPYKRVEKINGTEDVVDYTLVLDFDAVESDSTVVSYREFTSSQEMDLTNYRDIRFWVEDVNQEITTSRSNWFVYRFGSNDSTYYEYKTRRLIDDSGSVSVNEGWNSDDGIVIDLRKFQDLKADWFKEYGERRPSVNTAIEDSNGDTLRIYSRTEQMPSASAVRWIGFGVANSSSDYYISRVRINGLRATGLADREGWAMRTGVDLDFADFLSTNVNYNYTDADFRSMNQDVHSKGSSSMSSSVSGEVQLSKFLPSRTGVRLPVGASVSASLERPEIRPNSDISLRKEDGSADGFDDMAKDFWNVLAGNSDETADTESEKYQKANKEYRIYTGYRKNNDSKNPVVNLTADRIGVEYSYAVTDAVDRNGEIPEGEDTIVTRSNKFHIDELDRRAHNFTLDYDFTPTSNAKKKTSWAPFQKSKSRKMPRKIKNMKLNLLPTKFDLDLIKMDYTKEERYNSLYEVRDTSYRFTPIENLGINHGLDFNYEPIAPFTSINLTVNSKRDFDSYLKTWNKSGVGTFMDDGLFALDPYWSDYGILRMEKNRNHSSQFRLSPEFFTWLTTTAKLSSTYSQDVDVVKDTSFMKGDLGSGFSFESTLRTRRLFDEMGKWGDKGFSKSMKFIAKGFDKVDFESFNFSYTANMKLTSSYLEKDYLDNRLDNSAASYYAHTLGFHNRSFGEIVRGDMDDRGSFGGVQNRTENDFRDGSVLNGGDRRTTTQNIALRTSLKIPVPVDINLNQISLRWNRNYKITPKYGQIDTTVIWPDMKFGGSTPILRKLPSIKDHFRSLNLKSAFRYMKTTGRTADYFVAKDTTAKNVRQKVTYAYGLDPLIKIDGVLKKRKIDLGYSMSLMFDTTINSTESADEFNVWHEYEGSGHKAVTSNHVWTAGYKLPGRKGRTVKFFRGRVIELKGDANFNVQIDTKKIRNFKYDHTQTDKDPEEWDDVYLNITPKFEYDFTKNIGFEFYYRLMNQTVGVEERKRHVGELAGELTVSF